jgi:hypothetical protein
METTMKTLRLILALALLAGASHVSAVDPENKRSTSRYMIMNYTFSATTSDITDALVGVLPPGMILRDVVVAQASAGTGGTSWVAIPKKAGNALTSTNGGFTQAAGSSKVTNTAASPLRALSLPSGGTRPVIQKTANASGTVTVQAALSNNETTTICGITYTAKTSGATGLLEFNIGADENADGLALQALVNNHPSSPCIARGAGAAQTIVARNTGSAGNALGLAESGSGFVVSGANLTGGLDFKSAGGEIVTVTIDITGSYSPAVTGVVSLYFEPSY